MIYLTEPAECKISSEDKGTLTENFINSDTTMRVLVLLLRSYQKNESSEEIKKIKSNEDLPIKSKKERKKYRVKAGWTADEYRFLLKHLNDQIHLTIKSPELSSHTAGAIRQRISAIKVGNWHRIGKEIVPLLREVGLYQMAEQAETYFKK